MSDEDKVRSGLPRDIVRRLDGDRDTGELAADLGVTDARVAWYLARLASAGLVVELEGGRWRRTPQGTALLDEPEPVDDDVTVLPGRTVYDFRQAFADAAAGMFGEAYVQGGGEHGSRLSSDQAAEFQARLTELVAEYFAPGRGDRSGVKYGFHWVLTPTDLHPLDDE